MVGLVVWQIRWSIKKYLKQFKLSWKVYNNSFFPKTPSKEQKIRRKQSKGTITRAITNRATLTGPLLSRPNLTSLIFKPDNAQENLRTEFFPFGLMFA